MVELGGRREESIMVSVGWLVMWVAVSCGYPELPRIDVATDGQPGGDGSAEVPSPGASCTGLAETCGPNANMSCCRAETVPAGAFFRSYDLAPGHLDDMSYPAAVSTFVLDTYEVTVGRFRAFVSAGQGTQASPPMEGAGSHPRLAGSGWDSSWNASLVTDTTTLVGALKCAPAYQTWTDTPGINENKPINCVSWFEAMAFCIWDGGYLPTETEWNYAASGGCEQRTYPWSEPADSTDIDCTYANYNINDPPGTYCVNGATGGASRVGTRSPKGDGRWKQADLTGNVWEWTLDWYTPAYPVPCYDCGSLVSSGRRTVRGGSFFNDPSYLRAGERASNPPERSNGIGMRCARNP